MLLKIEDKKLSINAKQKGARIERSIVNWLKDQGVLSARRSEQYCGGNGDADVLAPDELPSFHIESKGTKSSIIPKSKLKLWYKQIFDDVKEGQLPVIFNEANGEEIVALVPLGTAIAMKLEVLKIETALGFSFTPSAHVHHTRLARIVAEKLGQPMLYIPCVTAFKVTENQIFLAIDGPMFVREMLKFEKVKNEEKVRLDKTVAGSERLQA